MTGWIIAVGFILAFCDVPILIALLFCDFMEQRHWRRVWRKLERRRTPPTAKGG